MSDASPEGTTVEVEAQGDDFDALLDYLKRSRGFNLGGYKRVGLRRRVQRRMELLDGGGVTTFGDYMDYLEVHPDEFEHFFNAVLINVTAFFRDAQSWEYLGRNVVPRILERRKGGGPIRVWSAACASGEEAYSIAITLAEALGDDQFRERVKIYGTDVDPDALGQARQGVYSARAVEGIPPALLDKYFERVGPNFVFGRDYRRAVIFGQHDLLKDAPISRVDLLSCRNALMYFNAEAQGAILDRFHYALNGDGFLFLGKAEMLFTANQRFTPLDMKHRIFTKPAGGTGAPAGRIPGMESAGDGAAGTASPAAQAQIREMIFDGGSVAQVVVDPKGLLSLINEQARWLLRLAGRDVGRPLQDLELSHRPVELRTAIDQAYSQRRPISMKNVAWPSKMGGTYYLDIVVMPLLEANGGLLGASITFADVTRTLQLQKDLEQSNLALETAYEELQSTNEELETTNEELQSTVEELETTNEELQSTNEELETMNEELQSASDETQTVNDELRARGEQLNQTNLFLESILGGLKVGVVVVDRDLLVRVWNHRSEDLWGLHANETSGTNLLNLDIGLPVERLKPPIRACIAGESLLEEVVLDATNRRGKPIVCKVTCTPLCGTGGEVRGAILLMEARGDEKS